MNSSPRFAAAVLVSTLLAACTSVRERMEYTPSPAEIVVPAEDGAQPQARVLVSVLGAERRDGLKANPFELRLRLRLESLGDHPVAVSADDLLVVDADLRSFGEARLVSRGTMPPPLPADEDTGERRAPAPEPTTPPNMLVAPAGGTAFGDVYVALPPDAELADLNLEGLNMRWRARVGERSLLLGTTFARVYRTAFWPDYPYAYPYYPYYGYGYPGWRSHVHFGVGYGW